MTNLLHIQTDVESDVNRFVSSPKGKALKDWNTSEKRKIMKYLLSGDERIVVGAVQTILSLVNTNDCNHPPDQDCMCWTIEIVNMEHYFDILSESVVYNTLSKCMSRPYTIHSHITQLRSSKDPRHTYFCKRNRSLLDKVGGMYAFVLPSKE